MKKLLIVAMVAMTTSTMLSARPVNTGLKPTQNVQSEEAAHPRIAKAIHEMEDALDYLQKAPANFGGHKADAIRDIKQAIKSLKQALHFKAVQDRKK